MRDTASGDLNLPREPFQRRMLFYGEGPGRAGNRLP